MKIDYLLSKKINDFIKEKDFLKALSLFFSDYLIFLMFLIIFLVYYFYRQQKILLIFSKIGLNLLFIWLGIMILRKVIPRLRPFARDQSIEKFSSFLIGPRGSSFPSFHTAVAFSLGFIILTDWPLLAIIILPFAFFVALGRIITGVHYLTDILGGIFLAAGVFLITELLIF